MTRLTGMIPSPTNSRVRRPGLVTGGFATTIAATVTGIATTVLWIITFNVLTDFSELGRARNEEALAAFALPFYLVVAFSFILAIGLGAGAWVMWYRNNVGRILIWSFGGVMIAWHVCCGTGNMPIHRTLISFDSYRTSGVALRYWQLDAAVISGFVSAVLCVIAVVLVAQRPVTEYVRKARPKRLARQVPADADYEPFADPMSAPATYWPYPGTSAESAHGPDSGNSVPSAAPGQWSDPPQPDDSVWRRPSDGGDGDNGGNGSFKPPK